MDDLIVIAFAALGEEVIEERHLHSAVYLLQEDLLTKPYLFKRCSEGVFSSDLQKDIDLLAILGGVEVLGGCIKYKPKLNMLRNLIGHVRRKDTEEVIQRFKKIIMKSRFDIMNDAYSIRTSYLPKIAAK
jgi:hypothetical protein